MKPLSLNQNESGESVLSEICLGISEQKKSGIIICKRFYAEFLGPGSAIAPSLEEPGETLILINSPIFVPLDHSEARQRAYNKRIQWIRWQEKMINFSKDPAIRSEKLLQSLEAFFGSDLVTHLSDEVLARLVGVLPNTLQTVRRQQDNLTPKGKGQAVSSWQPLSLKVFTQGVQYPPTATATVEATSLANLYANFRFTPCFH